MDRQLELLVVDDNQLDVERIERLLKKLNSPVRTGRARDGIEALEILDSLYQEQNQVGPLSILLDLNMPRMNGLEFLREVRGKRNYADIDIYILTTSNRQQDMDASNEYDIAGYLVKPIQIDHMKRLCQQVAGCL